MKGPTTFMKHVLGSCRGLSEESESMELTISEETRRGRLYIRSSKQQPGVVNKNRLLQRHSECLLIGGEKGNDQGEGEPCQQVTGVRQIVPVCVDQHVGQRHGRLRDMDSEPQHRL